MSLSAKRFRVLGHAERSSQSAICRIAVTKRISHCLRFWIGSALSFSYPLQD